MKIAALRSKVQQQGTSEGDDGISHFTFHIEACQGQKGATKVRKYRRLKALTRSAKHLQGAVVVTGIPVIMLLGPQSYHQ